MISTVAFLILGLIHILHIPLQSNELTCEPDIIISALYPIDFEVDQNTNTIILNNSAFSMCTIANALEKAKKNKQLKKKIDTWTNASELHCSTPTDVKEKIIKQRRMLLQAFSSTPSHNIHTIEKIRSNLLHIDWSLDNNGYLAKQDLTFIPYPDIW